MNILDYKNVIEEAVKIENTADTEWGWKLVAIGENKASIRWGYFDYLEDNRNIVVRIDEYQDGDTGVLGFLPNGSEVFVLCGKNFWDDCETIEQGLQKVIHGIAKKAKHIY